MAVTRTVVLEIPEGIAAEAEALGLNVENACREGLWLIMHKTRQAADWKVENREAIEGWNRWLETNKLPLERYRLF